MSISWIIADVDGCISPEASVPWDLDHFAEFARIVRAANRGESNLAPMTLCTGRPQPYVEVLMKLLDIRVPAICENGAVFYTLADNNATFDPAISETMLIGLRRLRAFVETEILPANPQVLMQFGKEAQMSLYSESPKLFPPIQQRIETFLRENNGPDLIIQASHVYLNLSFKGVNKGNALKRLQSVLGAPKEKLAGIGDTEGDLPLRETVGFFACPANARDAIKSVADYVSPYPELEGILDILSHSHLRIT
jgi:HAD superfamily hydrolase (TIGR01484 family)